MFSEFTGKYKTLEFEVSSIGTDDAETRKQEQNKYYIISIEGDELKGWTVKLGSKLKERIKTEKKEEDFTVKEIYDDSLEEGQRIIDKEGVKGLIEDTTGQYTFLEQMVRKKLSRKINLAKKLETQQKKLLELVQKRKNLTGQFSQPIQKQKFLILRDISAKKKEMTQINL